MRVVVISTKNGRAAVAGENGCMCYIKDKGYQRGQMLEIDDALMGKRATDSGGTIVPIRRASLRSFVPKASGIAAALCAAAVTGGMLVYAHPVRNISDVTEPEIEYSVNLFNRVIGVSAGTSEAEIETGVISHEVSGKTIDEAMEITRKLIEKEQTESDTFETPDSTVDSPEDVPQSRDTEPYEPGPPSSEEAPGDNTVITEPSGPENEPQSENKPDGSMPPKEPGDENGISNETVPEAPANNSGFMEQFDPDSKTNPDNSVNPDNSGNEPPQPSSPSQPPPKESDDGPLEPLHNPENDQTGERPPDGGPPPGDVPPPGDAPPH